MKKFLTLFAMLIATVVLAQQAPYWQNSPSGTYKNLLSISFGSSTVGYIGGADSLFMKTTDGGETWIPKSLPSFVFSVNERDIVDVQFLSADLGYIIVGNYENKLYQGAVYKTTDAGDSWTQINAGTIAAWRLHFFSEGNGFVVGSAFFSGNVVNKITSGTPVPAASHSFSYDPFSFNFSVDFRDPQMGIIGGEHGQMYRTFNGGTTWDSTLAINTGTDSPIYAIRFLNDSIILASTDGALKISYDTGATWQTDMNSLTFDYPSMKSIILSSKDSFVAVGYRLANLKHGILYWHDGEYNRVQYVDHALNDIALSDDSVSYAVGDSGLIVTNRMAPPVVGIQTPSFLESQLKVYPNPATGTFTTQLPALHTVKVYDISGRLIINRNKSSLKQTFDLSAYNSGTYFLDIKTDSERISSKLILK